ncbi:hypothetical protein Hanom_Chr08g00720501 [Helianthus anomalus]
MNKHRTNLGLPMLEKNLVQRCCYRWLSFRFLAAFLIRSRLSSSSIFLSSSSSSLAAILALNHKISFDQMQFCHKFHSRVVWGIPKFSKECLGNGSKRVG